MEITGILRNPSEAWNHKFNLIGVSLTKPADAFAIAMRGYLPILGITLDHGVDVAMEESIAKLYEALNAHFLKYPYILGGVPSLADVSSLISS